MPFSLLWIYNCSVHLSQWLTMMMKNHLFCDVMIINGWMIALIHTFSILYILSLCTYKFNHMIICWNHYTYNLLWTWLPYYSLWNFHFVYIHHFLYLYSVMIIMYEKWQCSIIEVDMVQRMRYAFMRYNIATADAQN